MAVGKEVLKTIITLITTAFALVVGLAGTMQSKH